MGLTVFAQRLKQLRERNGIKQNELAKSVGVTSNTISSYEKSDMDGNGKKPTLENAQAIAEYFGVSLDWLCGRSDTLSGGYTNLTIEQYLRSLVDIIIGTSLTVQKETLPPKLIVESFDVGNFIIQVDDLVRVYRDGSIPENLFEICVNKVISDYGKSHTILGSCILSNEEKVEVIKKLQFEHGGKIPMGYHRVPIQEIPFDDMEQSVRLYFSEHEANQINEKIKEGIDNGKHNPPKE